MRSRIPLRLPCLLGRFFCRRQKTGGVRGEEYPSKAGGKSLVPSVRLAFDGSMVENSKEFDDHRQLVQKQPGSIHKAKRQAVLRAWGDEDGLAYTLAPSWIRYTNKIFCKCSHK